MFISSNISSAAYRGFSYMFVGWLQFLYPLPPVHSHSHHPGSSSHYDFPRQLLDLLTSLPPPDRSLFKHTAARLRSLI